MKGKLTCRQDRENATNERGPSLQKGTGKRTAGDSLEDEFDQTQASKRGTQDSCSFYSIFSIAVSARVCDLREPAHIMGDQRHISSCNASTDVAHQSE